MKRTSLYFVGLQKVELREEELAAPGTGEVQVRSLVSAISSGTEMLIYKGEAPQNLQADTSIAALSGSLAFPLKYGYSMVGQVLRVGEGVDESWKDRKVFAFNPHETAFNADVNNLQVLPDSCEVEDAAFLANMETAVSLVQDGKPLLGEKVAMLGQGIVGLLVTALLSKLPIDMFSVDSIETRRDFSKRFGAKDSFAPDKIDVLKDSLGAKGTDLVYELSGSPEALNLALDLVGEYGRIVVGSWYGNRFAPVNLGEKFHRGHIKIMSSQVSQIEPALCGRWDKGRRFELTWKWLQEIKPSQLVTHRFLFAQAENAYKLLALDQQNALGVLLKY
jgi:threonine dehydrogenase-like Zn-dependent dehydrogenase